VRIGLVSPVLTQVPGVASPWEATAGVAEVVQVAQAADEAGLHHLTCSEHVAVPVDVAVVRGGVYWDPLATLGHLAAVTSRIRLATHVLVLGYHHPLQLAKSYGTLDVLSGGRVVLGVGVGSLEEEFALLDVPFTGRGARADEALRALRSALGRPVPSFDGSHYRYDGMVVEPHAVQESLPLWVGGRTLLSLRRAVALADGWAPFGLRPEEVRTMLDQVELPGGFEVVLHAARPLDPLRDPSGTQQALTRLRDAGATIVGGSVAATSADDCCAGITALAEIGAGS
jgi:probable F420-dependent oxidoreductase